MIPYVSVTAGSYYGELRYNYDYDHTLGIYAGKTFYLTADSSQSLIPQVGWLSGDIHAGSLQAYYILDTRKFFLEFLLLATRNNPPIKVRGTDEALIEANPVRYLSV